MAVSPEGFVRVRAPSWGAAGAAGDVVRAANWRLCSLRPILLYVNIEIMSCIMNWNAP